MQRATVRRWVERYENEGSLLDRVRIMPLRVAQQPQINQMLQHYSEQPFTATKVFAQKFECSVKTIRNYLHRNGVHNRTPAKKIALTEEHRTARLRFAREFRDFDFSNAIFSD